MKNFESVCNAVLVFDCIAWLGCWGQTWAKRSPSINLCLPHSLWAQVIDSIGRTNGYNQVLIHLFQLFVIILEIQLALIVIIAIIKNGTLPSLLTFPIDTVPIDHFCFHLPFLNRNLFAAVCVWSFLFWHFFKSTLHTITMAIMSTKTETPMTSQIVAEEISSPSLSGNRDGTGHLTSFRKLSTKAWLYWWHGETTL